MRKNVIALALSAMLFAFCASSHAQQPKLYRLGVLLPGEAWYEIIDGLRLGLRQLGLEEGKHFILVIRDWKGDVKMAEEAAKNFEQEKVDLIYATSTNSTLAAKRATADLPVILKEIVPKLRRVVTFYDPRRRPAIESSNSAREAARLLKVEFFERHVASVEQIQAGVRALRAGEFDAYFAVSDPMMSNESQLIIDTARIKKLPTMFDVTSHVIKGGLASYNVSFHEMGLVSAKYVQRIMNGIRSKDLPVEAIDKIALVINLKTAKDIGLTIPQRVLARADKVIR
jgi:putative ABC transport system substrate-binding protein